jgi:hypothetical protein
MRRGLVICFLVLIMCLGVVSAQSNCTIEFVSWKSQTGDRIDITDTLEGDIVSLYIYGSAGCEELEVSFEVFEDDFGLGDDSVSTNPKNSQFVNGVTTGTWIAEHQFDGIGKPEYYFKANIIEEKVNAESIHRWDALYDRGEELVVTKCDEDCRALGGICDGIPDSCEDVASSVIPQEMESCDTDIFCIQCEKQNGCGWKYNEVNGLYECKDNPKLIPCDEFSDRLGCVNQRGCEWVRGEDCELVSAYWDATSVIDGEEVELIVKGVNCNGQELKIEIFEDNAPGTGGEEKVLDEPLHVFFEGNIAVGVWKSEWQDDYEEYTGTGTYPDGTTVTTSEFELNPPEYFFIATLVEDEHETIRGGLKNSKSIFGKKNRYEISNCYDFDCELVVLKKGACKGELPLVECDSDLTGSYCENKRGCQWDSKDGFCYPVKCEYFNNNYEGCLDYSEFCEWQEGENAKTIKPEKEIEYLFCDWECSEDQTCNNGACEDLDGRTCSGEPITSCEDFDKETCIIDYQRFCSWITLFDDDNGRSELCGQNPCEHLSFSKTACLKHGCIFN